jgi:hypothetical protein
VTLRWEAGCRAHGATEVAQLWAAYGDRPTLMVVGAGFDPRSPVAYEQIVASAPRPPDVVRIGLDALETDAATEPLADLNRQRLEAAVQRSGAVMTEQPTAEIEAQSPGIVVARDFFAARHTEGYAQVVIDVSSLPRSWFFPLARGMLELHDSGSWSGDLHLIACDNPQVDALVAGEGVRPPSALPGFADHSPIRDRVTRIWVPVIGEGAAPRLEALYADIEANEICPVLPFPAANPRRCDDLLREHRELLFDRAGVEPRNLIYAAESNPYDLYRILSELNDEYAKALKPLGETRMILSAHSSKLLSIGVLLTAFEQGLEVRHVSPATYSADDFAALEPLASHNLLVDVWLTGEPYV